MQGRGGMHNSMRKQWRKQCAWPDGTAIVVNCKGRHLQNSIYHVRCCPPTVSGASAEQLQAIAAYQAALHWPIEVRGLQSTHSTAHRTVRACIVFQQQSYKSRLT